MRASPLLLLLACLACQTCKPDQRPGACASDRAALTALMDSDKKNDALVREADAAMTKGQGKQAAEVITRRAKPEAESLEKRAAAWAPSTRWGREQHAQIHGLFQARVRALGDYAAALSSDDLARVLEQLQVQRALEHRAIEVERKLGEPQALEACGPP